MSRAFEPAQKLFAPAGLGLGIGLGIGLGATSGVAGGGPTPVLGQVATRTAYPHAFGNTANYMVRTMHYNRAGSALTSLKAVWPNFATNNETLSGGILSITAAVEYPLGSGFTQLLFSGIAQGTADAATATITSDTATLGTPIPDNALFAMRFFQHNSVRIPFQDLAVNHNQALGDITRTGGTDLTMGGAFVDNTATTNMFPLAIVGLTTKHTFLIIGDSRSSGFSDTVDVSGDIGQIARAIGPTYPYMNMGSSGDRASFFAANHAQRVLLGQYADTVVDLLGINDIRSSVTAATLITQQAARAALFPGKRYMAGTIFPDTTSTDSWATLVNQTVPGNDTQRVSLNNHIRANAEGYAAALEIADLVENSRDDGKIKVDGTANKYTNDGLHLVQAGYLLASGVAIPP